jgi:hypothetical protein
VVAEDLHRAFRTAGRVFREQLAQALVTRKAPRARLRAMPGQPGVEVVIGVRPRALEHGRLACCCLQGKRLPAAEGVNVRVASGPAGQPDRPDCVRAPAGLEGMPGHEHTRNDDSVVPCGDGIDSRPAAEPVHPDGW